MFIDQLRDRSYVPEHQKASAPSGCDTDSIDKLVPSMFCGCAEPRVEALPSKRGEIRKRLREVQNEERCSQTGGLCAYIEHAYRGCIRTTLRVRQSGEEKKHLWCEVRLNQHERHADRERGGWSGGRRGPLSSCYLCHLAPE